MYLVIVVNWFDEVVEETYFDTLERAKRYADICFESEPTRFVKIWKMVFEQGRD